MDSWHKRLAYQNSCLTKARERKSIGPEERKHPENESRQQWARPLRPFSPDNIVPNP